MTAHLPRLAPAVRRREWAWAVAWTHGGSGVRYQGRPHATLEDAQAAAEVMRRSTALEDVRIVRVRP